MVKNQDGILTVIFVVALLLISSVGVGIHFYLKRWSALTQTQLRLDRCVGEVSQEFRNHLNEIESRNRWIHRYREALLAGGLIPVNKATLTALIEYEVVRQELILGQWKLKLGKWLITQGCSSFGDRAQPLPALNYFRKPPDMFGPNALEWIGKMPSEFLIQVNHSPRATAARISKGKNEKWKAEWTAPQQLAGTNPF